MKDNQATTIPHNILSYYQKIEEGHNRNLQVYQSLFDHNPEAVFSLDLNGNFTSANKVMARKAEYEIEDILKLNFKDLIISEEIEKIESYFDEAKSGGIPEFETRVKTTKGNILDVFVKALPIIVDGNIVGIYCIASDITQKLIKDQEVKELLDNLAKAYVEKDNILESITEGFFAIDSAWNFVYCNRVLERIWGIEKKQIIGKNFWDLIDLANAPLILMEFKKAFEKKVRVNFEMYYSVLNVWLDITAYPNDNGLSSIVKVVNEEKRLERLFTLEKDALERNTKINASAESIVEFLIDGLQKIHPDMTCSILHVRNNSLYNWYAPGLPKEYCNLIEGLPIGMNQGSCGTAAFLKEVVIIDDISTNPYWEKYKHLAEKFGFKACWSLPLLTKEKEVFATFAIYYKNVKKPSVGELNSLEKVRNLLTNIIINKQAEEQIRISKERYDIVARATNDAIWDCDLKTKEVIWNNGITSIFGYSREKVGNTIEWGWEKVHPDDKSRVLDKLILHIDGKDNTFSDEFRCVCADGSFKYVQNKVFIIIDENTKRATRLIGALQDVTAQKNTELQLRELNQTLNERAEQLATSNTELERFAYVASHDLQEPLRTITSFLQLFKRKYAGAIDSTADNYITFAVDGAERMKQLIMDMLEYSRVNTQLKLNEEVEMQQVVKDVIFNFSSKIRLTDAKIEVIGDMPKIFAVRTQMLQLFQNLIGNAIKYQKPGEYPHIMISCTENPQEWEFAIKDEGIGIEEKFYDKIFIIFQRLHTKTQFSGTGIGLAICKKIIEKHNGRIWVKSEIGKGSTFYFTIPRKIDIDNK